MTCNFPFSILIIDICDIALCITWLNRGWGLNVLFKVTTVIAHGSLHSEIQLSGCQPTKPQAPKEKKNIKKNKTFDSWLSTICTCKLHPLLQKQFLCCRSLRDICWWHLEHELKLQRYQGNCATNVEDTLWHFVCVVGIYL